MEWVAGVEPDLMVGQERAVRVSQAPAPAAQVNKVNDLKPQRLILLSPDGRHDAPDRQSFESCNRLPQSTHPYACRPEQVAHERETRPAPESKHPALT